MYKIIYPINTSINGENLSDAIKNFVKLQNDFNLTNLIIQNDNLYKQAYINYIKKNGKKIAYINTIPLNPLYPLSHYIKDTFTIDPMPPKPAMNVVYPIPVIATPQISPYLAF
jgi:hypothetical protein